MPPEPSNLAGAGHPVVDPAEAARLEVVFRARARRYAIPRSIEPSGRTLDILVFSLGASGYAFPLTHVQEVQPMPRLTPVPGAPPELAGVVSLRGEILCALDLQRTVALPVPASPPPHANLLVMRGRSRLLGLPVSGLTGVVGCDPRALLPLHGLDLAATAPLAMGLLADGVLLLDWLEIIRLPLFDAL